MRSVENEECEKCGVWKMGVWKMRSVEDAECGRCGVWKMRSAEDAECGNAKDLTISTAITSTSFPLKSDASLRFHCQIELFFFKL